MTSPDRVAEVARRHADDLRGALRAFTQARDGADDPLESSARQEPEPNHELRERLRAAADYADLPPQILLPAQFSHDSPHRRA